MLMWRKASVIVPFWENYVVGSLPTDDRKVLIPNLFFGKFLQLMVIIFPQSN
jgi:hypothetical protein